jgi:phosphate transport system permease protein
MQSSDKQLRLAAGAAATVSGAVVVFIALFVALESLPALQEIGAGFVGDKSWHPSQGLFNVLPMIVATLATTAAAVLLAAPVGLLVAIYIHCVARRWTALACRRLIEILAGIPSVVYGFWGLVTLVPLIGRLAPPGASLIAGGLILALMILPTIVLISGAAISQVPREYLAGAAALGMSRRRTITGVILPAARGGILTALILAVGRAVGETMAVLMVCGNVVQMPNSVFTPVRTLTANIALEMDYAMGTHRSALFATGLTLLLIASFLVIAARLLKAEERYG